MAEKKTYSIVRGVVKSLKVMAVFSIVALLIGLKPEIKD